jgi:hypothetical protein
MSNNPEITSVLFLNATHAKEVLEDPSKIMDLPNSIEEYCQDMQALPDIHTEHGECAQDNSDYAQCIANLS